MEAGALMYKNELFLLSDWLRTF